MDEATRLEQAAARGFADELAKRGAIGLVVGEKGDNEVGWWARCKVQRGRSHARLVGEGLSPSAAMEDLLSALDALAGLA